MANGINIDRSQFYPFLSKNILQLQDGNTRSVNRGEFDRYMGLTTEGWNSLRQLNYSLDESTGMVNVTFFDTGTANNSAKNIEHDLRTGAVPFKTVTSKRGYRMPLIMN